jgi:hypothetical protein
MLPRSAAVQPLQTDQATDKALDNLAAEISKLKIQSDVNFSPAEQVTEKKLAQLQTAMFTLIEQLTSLPPKLDNLLELQKQAFASGAEAGKVQLEWDKFKPKYDLFLKDYEKLKSAMQLMGEKIPDDPNISKLRKELKEEIKTTSNPYLIQKFKTLDEGMKNQVVTLQKKLFTNKKSLNDLQKKVVDTHNSFIDLVQRYGSQAKTLLESRAAQQAGALGFFNNNQPAAGQEQKQEQKSDRPAQPNRGGNN